MTSISQCGVDEMKHHVEVLGVKGLSAAQITQMAELEQKVYLTGLVLRRVPSKQDEPAFHFPEKGCRTDLPARKQGGAQ